MPVVVGVLACYKQSDNIATIKKAKFSIACFDRKRTNCFVEVINNFRKATNIDGSDLQRATRIGNNILRIESSFP